MLDRALKFVNACKLLEEGFYMQYFTEKDRFGKTIIGPPNSKYLEIVLTFSRFLRVYLKLHKSLVLPADSASNGTDQANPIVPHVGAYAAQCSLCFKLRSIPSKKKFEKICANKKQSFVCASVCKWRPEVSCNNDADLPEDGSLKFAIEKQNIARLPRGWKRRVKIRRHSEGARFADVYYFSPSGQRLRSNTDVERYLRKHPDEAKRVRLSQFSFQPPKPAYRLKRPSDV